ncbi:UDP-glucose flavonoid 3-O-glucosyltransferase 7-like [Argentina anserina]|uniref:UDP-glucose flavonoid 3-O-glucosyltransferase 7-like n=1 Tax=Argentina anserina TaxID=57926 RepID=UPI00217690B3|nr:UDP-glucose flavonoid 3-O-glucosyltransferase 7-like [Potentilla anserina]
MDTKTDQQLQIFFLPYMAHGHTLPLIDTAKFFASHGSKSTIITTPFNAPLISKSIQSSKSLGLDIDLLVINFPSTEVGLPEGIENANLATNREMKEKLYKASTLFAPQVEQILEQYHPHCLIADSLYHWSTDAAAKFGIPRITFHGVGYFPLCASLSVILYQPHIKVSSDTEPFVIPNLPHEIKSTRNQVPAFLNLDGNTELIKLVKASVEAETRSYGNIVNSFYELEPDYAHHYRNVLGRKSWHIGPVSLCNKAEEDKSARGGKEGSADRVHECIDWLNKKEVNSVVYICFGSLTIFSDCQLIEIASALEASHQQFIWVVRKEHDDEEEWLLKEFEQRMEGEGLIISGWAPQLLILEHEATGAFVTHCGWNSILEGVSAGVPMITWPVTGEQFYNEKLVTELLGIGVAVGAEKWATFEEESARSEANVKREAIEKAVTEIMVGDKAEDMRSRAKALGEMASRAVEEGGSSFSDLTALIEELKSIRS